jgi:mRNA interferase MazF
MRRTEIWTVSGGPNDAGKPRPAVIIQDDRFDTTEAPLFRLEIESSPRNGLRDLSRLMVDKITTVSRSKLGESVRVLDDADGVRLNRAIVVALGMAGTACPSQRTDPRGTTHHAFIGGYTSAM